MYQHIKRIRLITILFTSLVFTFSCTEKKIKVACVGDYITSGSEHLTTYSESYPFILGELLGNDYEVMNFGVSEAKVNKQCSKAYIKSNNYGNLQIYNPDIIILIIGSNDAKPQLWDEYAERLRKDYEEMLDALHSLPASPKVYICTPICSFQNEHGIDDYTVSQKLSTMIRTIGKEKKLDLIDLNAIFPVNQSLFSDNLHPDAKGNDIIAKEIFKKLTGKSTESIQ